MFNFYDQFFGNVFYFIENQEMFYASGVVYIFLFSFLGVLIFKNQPQKKRLNFLLVLVFLSAVTLLVMFGWLSKCAFKWSFKDSNAESSFVIAGYEIDKAICSQETLIICSEGKNTDFMTREEIYRCCKSPNITEKQIWKDNIRLKKTFISINLLLMIFLSFIFVLGTHLLKEKWFRATNLT